MKPQENILLKKIYRLYCSIAIKDKRVLSQRMHPSILNTILTMKRKNPPKMNQKKKVLKKQNLKKQSLKNQAK